MEEAVAKAGFLYGTSGWSYKDWVGPFYPEGTAERDYLGAYAERFSAVEVDSTYYGIPPARMVEGWARRTPAKFLFAPKMAGEVTHERFLEDCADPVAKFLASMKPLGRKLGPVILQFPYFRKSQNVTLDIFLQRLEPFLDGLPAGFRFAVETRNKTFLTPRLFEALRRRKAALVLVDHVWMPGPKHYLEHRNALTADFAVIRLLGDRHGIEKKTRTWEKAIEDKTDRIRGWAEVARLALSRGISVQAFANNHFAGHAPATIGQMAGLVGP